LRFGKRFFVAAQVSIDGAEVGVGNFVSRITLRPRFVGSTGLLQIAGNEIVVVGVNIKFFALAGPVPQLLCFLRKLRRQAGLGNVVVCGGEAGIGHCKIRIKLDGTL
jgi:hypothetical protein